MSKHRVAVLKVVAKQLSVTAAAAAYGMSRQHLHRLLHRYRDGGLEALEPRSRRPRSNPGRTPDAVRARVVALDTGEILSTHLIEPDRRYWRNQRRDQVPHVSPMSRLMTLARPEGLGREQHKEAWSRGSVGGAPARVAQPSVTDCRRFSSSACAWARIWAATASVWW